MKSTMMMMIEWMFLIKTYRIEICSSYQFTSLIISTQISPLSDWLNTNVSICYPPLLHSPLSNGGRGKWSTSYFMYIVLCWKFIVWVVPYDNILQLHPWLPLCLVLLTNSTGFVAVASVYAEQPFAAKPLPSNW